jgi:peptidoglycan/LPS O-acetylase OafA/YrhL
MGISLIPPPQPEIHKTKKIYFPNLDGLRSIAVFLVVVWHIEIHKVRFGFKQLFFNDTGFMGVSIFFLLSGFLITYILLTEKELNQKINFKAFYMRRILRIWPLYFFTLFFGFFIYPRGMSLSTLSMCLLLLPNIPFMLGHIHPYVQPIWSIGVEEQFYLFHPQFFRLKNKKATFIAIAVLAIFLITFKEIGFKFPGNFFLSTLANYLYYFRIEQLLMGSMGAIIVYGYNHHELNNNAFVRLLFSKYVQILSWVYFAGHIFMTYFAGKVFSNNALFVIAVMLVVMNLCIPATSIIQLNKNFLRYLGKVSYGIYLLHNIVLISVLYLLKQYTSILNPILINVIVYGLTLPLTVLIAGLSYKYYESYFLRLKVKFSTVVKSNDLNNFK